MRRCRAAREVVDARSATSSPATRRVVLQPCRRHKACCGASGTSIPHRASSRIARTVAIRRWRARSTLGPQARHCRSGGVEAAGPRRRGVSDRDEVGGRGARAGAAAFPGLQRRRVGAGHLQGPRAPRRGPVRHRRGDDDCGVRHGLRARLHLHSGRVSARAEARVQAAIGAARARRPARRQTCWDRGSRSTSRSVAAPAPTSAARRRRSSTRSRAGAASRGRSRRFRRRSACSASRPSSTTSRRWSTCSISCSKAARRGRAIGTRASTGTRLFCLSGHVAQPGLYEAPFGADAAARSLTLAGGVADGRPLQAVLLGGAAGMFVGPEALDVRLTFEDVRAAGATLGSGVVMVFDDTRRSCETRSAASPSSCDDETCGQCVPCRVGTVRQLELLERCSGTRAVDWSRPHRRGCTADRARPGDAGRIDLRPRPDGVVGGGVRRRAAARVSSRRAGVT